MGNAEVIGYSGKQTVKTLVDSLLNLSSKTSATKQSKGGKFLSKVNIVAGEKSSQKDNSVRFDKLLKVEKARISSTHKQANRKNIKSNTSIQDNLALINPLINLENNKTLKVNSKNNLTAKQDKHPVGLKIEIPVKNFTQLKQHFMSAKKILPTIPNDALSTSNELKNKTDFGVGNQIKDIPEVANRTVVEKNLSNIYRNLSQKSTDSQTNLAIPDSQLSQQESIEPNVSGKPRVLIAPGVTILSNSAIPNKPGIQLSEFAQKLETTVVVENAGTSAIAVKSSIPSKSDLKSKTTLEKDSTSERSLNKQSASSKNTRKTDNSHKQDSGTKSDLSDQEKQSPVEKNNSVVAQSGDTTSRNSINVKLPPVTPPVKNVSVPETPVDQAKLVDNIKLTLSSGRSELKIQLKPEVLGNALITLRKTDNGLEMEFQVESAQAKQAIEAEAPQIREALAALGIQTSSIDVRTSDGNPERFAATENGNNGQREQEKRGRGSSQTDQQTDSLTKFRSLGYNTFEIAA